jgi:hypothetical protein
MAQAAECLPRKFVNPELKHEYHQNQTNSNNKKPHDKLRDYRETYMKTQRR